jgi:hypothetical protein
MRYLDLTDIFYQINKFAVQLPCEGFRHYGLYDCENDRIVFVTFMFVCSIKNVTVLRYIYVHI